MIFRIIISLLTIISQGQNDFLEGEFGEGYGVSLYVTPEGKLRTLGNDWDLNDDGYLDIVIINEFERQEGNQVHDTYSYVLWGGPDGFERTNCDSFETHGAECAALADFDRDGWTDIVVANSTHEYSYLIYGSSQGYTDAKRDSFKAKSNHGSITVTELNRDGWLDLVWSDWYIGGGGYTRIYWGSEQGFNSEDVDSFLAGPAHGNIVADFDSDGYADILWAVYYVPYDTTRRSSKIFWGGMDGFNEESITELPSVGPGDDISVGDLNKDGLLDIVIPNHSSEPPPEWTAYDYSYIYYGEGNRRFRMDSLYAHGPWASSVADVDNDGWLDIVFACSADNHSLLYKGSPNGFTEAETLSVNAATCAYIADFNNDGFQDIVMGNQAWNPFLYVLYQTNNGWKKDTLTLKGIDGGLTRDMGNPLNHLDETWFTSPKISLTESSDSLALFKGHTIDIEKDWQSDFPVIDTCVSVWICVNKEVQDGEWSDWIQLESVILPTLLGRAYRYRLLFKNKMRTSLLLNEIQFHWQLGGNPFIVNQIDNFFDIHIPTSSFEESNINLFIYDRLGRRVRTIHPDLSGHAYWFGEDDSGLDHPPGVYFLVAQISGRLFSQKIVLLPQIGN
ncbi:T9SS type A sorting domain-containing protein [candidate division WOR-3 bacterium]|nr:T9SS type A sorting domain-containing protein [candidate division WOR-3 bacterium]